MLENRKVTKRVFPELFAADNMRPIGEYTSHLFAMLASLSPRNGQRPVVVVLTPGIYNAAYFEHSYLAQQMGAELVEGEIYLLAAMTVCICAPLRGQHGLMSSIVVTMICFSIPRCLTPIQRWACQALCVLGCVAKLRSPTHRAPAWPTTRRSIPTCRT